MMLKVIKYQLMLLSLPQVLRHLLDLTHHLDSTPWTVLMKVHQWLVIV